MVGREDHVGLAGEQLDRLGQVMRPDVRVADQGPAQGQQVVQVVGGVLGHAQRPAAGEVEVHLGWSFGTRSHLEDHPHAVHGQLLAGGGDGHGRVDQRDRAGRGGLAQPGSYPAFRAAGQRGAVHVSRPAGHRRSGVDVLRDRVLDKALGCDDLHPARVDIGLGHHPLHPAEVVGMAVGVDHRDHRPVSAVLAV